MYPERYYTPAKHFIEIQTMNVKTGENWAGKQSSIKAFLEGMKIKAIIFHYREDKVQIGEMGHPMSSTWPVAWLWTEALVFWLLI